MNKPNHLNFGARVPQVSFLTRSENDWLDVSSLPSDPFEVSDAMTMLEAMGEPAAQSA